MRFLGSAIASVFFISALNMATANAATMSKQQIDHLTVVSSEITEVPDLGFGKMGNLDIPSLPKFRPTNDEVQWQALGFNPGMAIGIGDIVNIGRVVWDIISTNRPVANMETDMATALPKGAMNWQQMVNWRTDTKVYNATYKNKLGHKVIDFTYRVLWTHSGQVMSENKAMPGAYLTGMTVIPTNLKVSWGYQVNAAATVPTATLLNVGTTENPVASARIFLNWGAHSMFFSEQTTKTWTITGDGSMKDTSGDK